MLQINLLVTLSYIENKESLLFPIFVGSLLPFATVLNTGEIEEGIIFHRFFYCSQKFTLLREKKKIQAPEKESEEKNVR